MKSKKKLESKVQWAPGINFKYTEELDEETNIITMKAIMTVDLNKKSAKNKYEKQKEKSTYMMWKYLKKEKNPSFSDGSAD